MRKEEAEKKWCPFARNWDFVQPEEHIVGGINRDEDGGPDSSCLCITDRCMAWEEQGYRQTPEGDRVFIGDCRMLRKLDD